jgi:glycosyltransferase involved in cell wall biosynthesis
MRKYAIIPTHNRTAELEMLMASIGPGVDILVIDNASRPSTKEIVLAYADERSRIDRRPYINYIRDEEQPPNLSRLWNVGLDWAQRVQRAVIEHGEATADEEYAVAILNDDVVLPAEFIERMARALLMLDVDIAFPGPHRHSHVNRRKGPVPLHERMAGWCFVVRGSSGLRADERLRWWCGDDDLEQSALQGGRGTVAVGQNVFNTGDPSTDLRHLYPDQSTVGVLREQTEKDMATFVKKWGFRPW